MDGVKIKKRQTLRKGKKKQVSSVENLHLYSVENHSTSIRNGV